MSRAPPWLNLCHRDTNPDDNSQSKTKVQVVVFIVNIDLLSLLPGHRDVDFLGKGVELSFHAKCPCLFQVKSRWIKNVLLGCDRDA